MPRKKKEETVVEEIQAEATPETTEAAVETQTAEAVEAEAVTSETSEETVETQAPAEVEEESVAEAKPKKAKKVEVEEPIVEVAQESKKAVDPGRGNRAQRVGLVTSDKMTKTVVVRVDRLIKHPKYRRYVRRKKQFMAHDEIGAAIGDKVRIVETRPLSARKRWRVVEIVQKAAK